MTSGPHRTTFIIPACNEPPPILEATINGILQTTVGYERELIVIDNGSREPVRFGNPAIRVVRFEQPIGVVQARRFGATLATGDVLCWLDAHMTFALDWFGHMMSYVDSGSLLCSSWWSYDHTRCHTYGADFEWRSGRDYHKNWTPGFVYKGRLSYPGPGAHDVPMIIGACYMMLRESYEAMGGYSPMFRVWGASEPDMSARAWMAGYGVKCVAHARVGHLTRPHPPYALEWEHIEFNRLMMLRTVFEEGTVAALEEHFRPIPPAVERWFEEVDWRSWRECVQSKRRISDAEFFARHAPDVLPLLEGM